MAVANFALNFCLRDKCSYGVDNNKINGAGSSKNINDFKCLLTSIRLRAKQVINIYTEFFSINWIKRVFSIDERTGQSLALRFSDYRKSQSSLTRRFRAVNFNNTTTR